MRAWLVPAFGVAARKQRGRYEVRCWGASAHLPAPNADFGMSRARELNVNSEANQSGRRVRWVARSIREHGAAVATSNLRASWSWHDVYIVLFPS